MKLSSRSLMAIGALIALEGIVMLVILVLHGGYSWGDLAGTIALVLASALVAGLALRWTSG